MHIHFLLIKLPNFHAKFLKLWMDFGRKLLSPHPEEVVLEMLAPEIDENLYNPGSLATPDPATISFEVKEENHEDELDDDVASVCSTVSSQSTKHFFLVDVEKKLNEFSLLAAARDVPPIDKLFSGFRLDSHMYAHQCEPSSGTYRTLSQSRGTSTGSSTC
ncbi:hypothetical protein PsorP6_016790 [Peronosclerospora sorghi]|uniref:Uncharacterized protein n=1 Tax=Peronosclerospora sorghi TaxID=230839 RepID=A0ACC0WEM8_9STRA|nr:hypothetical protein PsorP6_016790 [Peronosclerospora sorghi]